MKGLLKMLETSYIDYILQGHELYWNMLGNIRGIRNHKSDISWLSGDIDFTYSILLNDTDYCEQISQIVARIRSREIPNNLVITPGSAPEDIDLLGCFMKTGLFKTGFTSLGMLKTLAPNTCLPPSEKCLNIFRVNDLQQLKMCGAILTSSFEYILFTYEHYIDAFHMHHVRFYLAEYNGLPVGACMSILGDEFVEIAWVGTLVGYRKKGIGGYLVNAAEIDALQLGKSISVLTASEGAVNAYKRIGYQGYCNIDTIFLKDGVL